MKNKSITKDELLDWEASRKRTGKLEDTITERISYVLNFLVSTFGGSIDTWYFSDAAEGEVGNLAANMNDETIYNLEVDEGKDSDNIIIIDKFDDEWHFEGCLPTRWLFEDTFEVEVLSGKQSYLEKEVARKLKQKEQSAAKKKEDKDIVDKLKSKLTKRELAALKRSL